MIYRNGQPLTAELFNSFADKEMVIGVLQEIARQLGKDIDVAEIYSDMEKRREVAEKLREPPTPIFSGPVGYQGVQGAQGSI